MKNILLNIFSFLLLFSSASSGQNYVKVIERQSGRPLDSFLVSFYHVSGSEVGLQGESITDTNGIAMIPDSLNHCNEIRACQLREPHRYWPGIEYLDDNTDKIVTIKIDNSRGERWTQCNIYFEEKSTDINDRYFREMSKWLSKIATILKDHPSYDLEVGSHADTHSEHRGAKNIAAGRANAVKEWLLKHKVNIDQIVIKNEADKKPRTICKKGKDCTETDTENRRVDLRIIAHEP
jgi:outer membrane protein OmpA-like peptidoglycan-associated protein